MKMLTSTKCIFIFAINLFLLKRDVRAQLSSPCPKYFTYNSDESGGIIKLPVLSGVNNLKVRILYKGYYDKSSSAKIDLTIDLKTGVNIIYDVKFPKNLEFTPQIQSIVLNKQEYCNNEIAKPSSKNQSYTLVQESLTVNPESQKTAAHQQLIIYSLNPTPKPTLSQNNNEPSSVSNSSWIKNFPFTDKCGIHSIAVHTIINGREVNPNEFPWLVALFDKKRNYFCGGSLISDKHVITAAHCCIGKEWVYLEFGKHDLSDVRESGTVIRISEKIINHPEYKERTGHADISLITVLEKIIFSPKIKPICLWSFLSHDVGKKGTVAGWGNDISGSFTDTPMAAEVSIVSDEECLSSNNLYKSIVSNSTFCAGGANKGPCSGDSGSGFILHEQNRWYLKGVISVAITSNARGGSCDVNKFAVYCDVGKYLGWLKDFLI